MLDSLFGRGDVPKCKNLIKIIKSRVDFSRKKRNPKVDMLRRDVTEFLTRGQYQNAFFRVELLLAEENVLTGYDMIERFCDCVLKQPFSIQRKKDCPEAIKEAVSSLIFAAARCAEIPELQKLRGLFATRYGDAFAIAAVELHPDCGVSQKIIEKFSSKTPSNDAKLKLMKDIADKAGLQWDDSNLEAAKFCSLKDSQDASSSKCFNSFQKRVNSNEVLDSEFSRDVEKHKTAISCRIEDSRPTGCEVNAYERDIPVVSSSLREIPVIPDDISKTSQVKQMKSFSSSRTNAHKSFSSLSDSNGQANIGFVDIDAASVTEPVDQADRVRYLAADGEKISYKWIKAETVDFDAGLENKEGHGRTRQAGKKSQEKKNPCQTNAYQHKDIKIQYSDVNAYFPEESRDVQTKYTNGYANTSFLEERKWVPEKDFGLKSAAPLKSNNAYKTKSSDGPTELGENGVQDGSHGRHNRSSRCKEQDADYVEVRKFTRPSGVLDTDATQECKSEFQVLSTNGNKVGSKSSKRHPRSSQYDTENDNIYDNPCSFTVTNGSDYTAVEPSVRKSTGRKRYNNEGIQESSTLNNSSLNYPDNEEQACQIIGDKIKNGVHIQMHSSNKRHDYWNTLDSDDGTFIKVDNISAARCDPSPVNERLSSRESGRRAYYASEAATHEEARRNYRSESDKGSKYLNTRSHGVTNNASQTGYEEEHEIYHSVQETFYENTESNLNSFHRVPHESQKHKEKGERTGRRLYIPDDLSCKNIYHVDDHVSGSETQHLKQPESRKEYTRSTHPQNVESTKRSHVSLQTQNDKPRGGSKNSLDSPHAYVDDVHQNSDLQEQYFQGTESLGSSINETHMAGGKSERSCLDGRRGSSKLLECKKGYPLMEEPFASSLEDVHQSDEYSAKIRRYDRLQSENKEKVYTPRNSIMGIAGEEVTQQSDQMDGIAEAKDCSIGKGRRQDIQHPESHRSRHTRRAHHIQSESLQSECLESASDKNVLKSTQSHSYINSHLPPLPPTCASHKSSCFSPEHSSQHGPYSSIIPGNGSPLRRPSEEPYRSVSLPPKAPVRSASLQSKLLKSSSDTGISSTAHVHPKLPDYDDLAARFAALKQQRQSSNTFE